MDVFASNGGDQNTATLLFQISKMNRDHLGMFTYPTHADGGVGIGRMVPKSWGPNFYGHRASCWNFIKYTQ